MFPARYYLSLVFCCVAFHSSLAVEDSRELTTEEIAAHPEVQGALRAIDAWLEGVYLYERLAGVSAGIVHDQELIWANGYGHSNVETGRPADADTIYQDSWVFEMADDAKAARVLQDGVYWTRIK